MISSIACATDFEVERGVEAEETPEACAADLFVFRFNVIVALVDLRRAAWVINQVGFGLAVAGEDGVFGALDDVIQVGGKCTGQLGSPSNVTSP